jgi:hypothetical protein
MVVLSICVWAPTNKLIQGCGCACLLNVADQPQYYIRLLKKSGDGNADSRELLIESPGQGAG